MWFRMNYCRILRSSSVTLRYQKILWLAIQYWGHKMFTETISCLLTAPLTHPHMRIRNLSPSLTSCYITFQKHVWRHLGHYTSLPRRWSAKPQPNSHEFSSLWGLIPSFLPPLYKTPLRYFCTLPSLTQDLWIPHAQFTGFLSRTQVEVDIITAPVEQR